ncbi:MAG: hypothetical protein PHW98_03865 [Candidatus Omnitrophica bacterium]|nr:hypothetical protein [Candidatus Omnitrophota bacterium]MDD5770932.1 hypothetical protein [Candidatus Omnitrophota bacterium]
MLDIRRHFFYIRLMQKEDLYKGVKTAGLVSFIPFMLAAGPLSGYFVGTFLQEKFNLSYLTVLFGVFFGFLSAVFEIIRILKVIGRTNKK